MTASFIVRSSVSFRSISASTSAIRFSRGFRTRERSAMIPDRSFRIPLGFFRSAGTSGSAGRPFRACSASSFQPTFSRNRW